MYSVIHPPSSFSSSCWDKRARSKETWSKYSQECLSNRSKMTILMYKGGRGTGWLASQQSTMMKKASRGHKWSPPPDDKTRNPFCKMWLIPMQKRWLAQCVSARRSEIDSWRTQLFSFTFSLCRQIPPSHSYVTNCGFTKTSPSITTAASTTTYADAIHSTCVGLDLRQIHKYLSWEE
jgi:hypothetical protein